MLERLEIPDCLGNHDCSGSIGGQLLLDILQQQSPQLVEFNYTNHHHKVLWPDFNDFSRFEKCNYDPNSTHTVRYARGESDENLFESIIFFKDPTYRALQ